MLCQENGRVPSVAPPPGRHGALAVRACGRADGATPGTQLHQLTLSYSFEVAPDKEDKPQPVLPRVQALHSQLYDSPLDSLLWRRRWS